GAVVTLNSATASTLTFEAGDNIIFNTGTVRTTGAAHAVALNADQEGGASADGVRGSVTQTTAATSVAPTANTLALSINAANGIGGAGQSFVFDADTLSTDSSSLNANQFLTEINSVTVTSLTAGTGTITLT